MDIKLLFRLMAEKNASDLFFSTGAPPHMKIEGLKRESFEQWVRVFFETLDEIYEEDTSLRFKETGAIMAQNFMRNLGIY